MRRAALVIALLLTACDGGNTEKPSKDEKAPAKAEKEVEAETPQPEAESKEPPPGVKVHGNLPVRTESELKAEDDARSKCVSECVESKKAEAKAAEAIEAECTDKCMQELPIEQVEVVPDGPMPAPQ